MQAGEEVYLLTEDQAAELGGQQFTHDSWFNPIQDANDNWIISIEEVEQCVNPDFMWVKTLPLIIYIPKPFEM